MLAGNEEPHLALAGMEELERTRREDRRLSRASLPPLSAPEARREMSSGMSAAPFGKPSQSQAAEQTKTQAPASKMELTGRMTLTGTGGQSLGVAEINAEMGR
jgi:hypothetical protein